MASLPYLNAFISERLTAAAVEIFGAVEETLIEYQQEISRSKQEIDHLRKLVLWPEVRLHRSAAHQVNLLCCDKEVSSDGCPEEEWAPDPSTLRIKEEHEHRADQAGPSCREQGGTPHFPKRDLLEICHRERDDEQQYAEHDWSRCQDHRKPDHPQIKVEKFPSSSPQEETEEEYELPPESERSVYDEPHSSSPNCDQTLSTQTFYTAEERRGDGEGKGCQLSRLTQASQPFYAINQSYGENSEGVVNGEWTEALKPTGTRPKKRQYSDLCSQGRESLRAEEGINDLTLERRHTCPICVKRFKESSHLKEHMRIHTGEKPYQCKECGVNFRQSGALTLHMRIHTGERPFPCTDCGQRFSRKGDMETHRVTHTGERPHLCVVCGRSFKRKYNLSIHLKTHAEDKMDYTRPL